jgi:excisionase family DNA binding protein
MVQGYYSLEEAARILGMGAEELSQLAQKREVRAFADRGTWRFRTQDVEELARRRGQGSSTDLPIHDAPGVSPKEGADVFNFALGGESDQVEIGQEILSESPSSARKGSGSKGRTPTPRAGSDSDVRLVAEGGGVGFRLSDSKVTGPRSGPRSGPKSGGSGPKSGGKKPPSKPASDSDVKIVTDSSEEVALGGKPSRTGSDSDVRLDLRSAKARGPDDSFLTEEIDLDAEIKKDEIRKAGSGDKHRPSPSGTAPFELSESDLALPGKKPGASDSSDFDLSLDVAGDLSPLEPTSDELPALKSKKRSDEVPLGQRPKGVSESDSGISLAKPADGGLSLEKKRKKDSSDEISFEIAREPGSTPKPQKTSAEDSSSEFELTLEDSARLMPEDDAGKDIFETDFEVPALEDSGSGAVKLDDSDTDLESSDFDLALGDEDVAAEEESGSQVVALEDEENVDEGAATVARPAKLSGKGRKALVEDDEGELIASEDEEEVITPVSRAAVAAPAAPADWGVLTPTVLIFSVLVMFVLGIMGFELVRGMWGYHQPNKVSSLLLKSVGSLFYDTKELDLD